MLIQRLYHRVDSRTSFYVHPLWFPLIAIVLGDFRQCVSWWGTFTHRVHAGANFTALQNLGALDCHNVHIYK